MTYGSYVERGQHHDLTRYGALLGVLESGARARVCEEQKKTGRGFVGVLHALHQRVTKQAASWWLPKTLDGKIRPAAAAAKRSTIVAKHCNH